MSRIYLISCTPKYVPTQLCLFCEAKEMKILKKKIPEITHKCRTFMLVIFIYIIQHYISFHYSDVTSASLHHDHQRPVTQLFVDQLVQDNNKEISKPLRYWSFELEINWSTVQRVNDVESISRSWHHHDMISLIFMKMPFIFLCPLWFTLWPSYCLCRHSQT